MKSAHREQSFVGKKKKTNPKNIKNSISSAIPFFCVPGIPQQLLKAYK